MTEDERRAAEYRSIMKVSGADEVIFEAKKPAEAQKKPAKKSKKTESK